ncbi:unnamed protein product [Ascophyllum nodosum]
MLTVIPGVANRNRFSRAFSRGKAMKTAAFVCAVAAFASTTNAFVGSLSSLPSQSRPMAVRRASSLRMANPTVPGLIKQTRELKLLSTAAKLGLLSKLEKAGLSLKDVEKLLPLVDENDLIGLAKGLGPDLLKVAPAALSAAPAALPLVASALSVPGEALFAAALASVAAGLALLLVLPHDSLPGVALETFLVIPLLFVLPAVCAVGGIALSGLKKGWLINNIASYKPAPSKPAPKSASSGAPAIGRGPAKAAKAVKEGPVAAVKSTAAKGRPAVNKAAKTATKAATKVAAKAEKAVKAAPKPKPIPKPKSTGNIKNIPKAL